MAASKKTPETTQAPDKRDDTTDENVTELAKVDGNTTLADMKGMSGATDKDASTQQKDALEGLKQAKEADKHPERDVEPHPFSSGPGSDVA